jgi:GalNAc-alpha-(1->4)-GalNAc-alpha-(1->3)-diNAcBac-PP-undecaprenol alpha-1,4-N-acetyl-D-galactosaminyltransferase
MEIFPLDSNKTAAQRIAVVIYSLRGGGAERVTVDLCRYLRDSGREVTLLTLSGDDPDAYAVPDGIRRERMEIRRVAYSPLQTIWYFLSRIAAMRRRIRALEPDIVISFMDLVNVWTLLCLLGTGIPVIVSERVHPAYNSISRAWKVARRLIYPIADAVIVQTKEGAEWFRRWTRVKRLVVVPNAVRYSQEPAVEVDVAAAPVSRPYILAIGRFEKQKGFDLLLDAFHRSGLMQMGWSLTILGKGPERSALEQKAVELGIVPALTMPGFVDVVPWLKQADLFVLSSRFEGFPNVLVEAMQMRRACISFACPSGPSDLIENNRNGLLVPVEDVDGLSEALRRLAVDPGLRQQYGTEASKVVEQLSTAKVYGRWLRLIDAVAAGKAHPMFSQSADAHAGL